MLPIEALSILMLLPLSSFYLLTGIAKASPTNSGPASSEKICCGNLGHLPVIGTVSLYDANVLISRTPSCFITNIKPNPNVMEFLNAKLQSENCTSCLSCRIILYSLWLVLKCRCSWPSRRLPLNKIYWCFPSISFSFWKSIFSPIKYNR